MGWLGCGRAYVKKDQLRQYLGEAFTLAGQFHYA